MNHDFKLAFKHFQKTFTSYLLSVGIFLSVSFMGFLCISVFFKCLKHLDLIVCSSPCMQIVTQCDFLKHNLFLLGCSCVLIVLSVLTSLWSQGFGNFLKSLKGNCFKAECFWIFATIQSS